MKKSAGLFVIALFTILMFPLHALAVDFTINETKIDAYLGENGNVQVKETHTYEFDRKFNGITRSILPKDGTSITDFKAAENGAPLEVELEDETYKIFRGGNDETVTIELSYLIHHGVEVYADMAQFYWPFFDSNNENDYENLTVSIHPPQPTTDVIAYGFDAAYGAETIQNNGVVTFRMGLVDSGKNGDIRVAYNHALFSAAAVSQNKPIRDELIREQQKLADKQKNFLSRQESLGKIAPYVTGGFALLLLLLLVYGWRKRQTAKLEAERLYNRNSIVPKEVMSMPATIYYFRGYMSEFNEMLTTGMMDLVRKGNIEALENETYHLVDSNTDVKHEAQLIHLLFKKIGKNGLFSFELLKKYLKVTVNQMTFNNDLNIYRKAIIEEVDSHHLFDKQVKLRLGTGFISLLLIPLMIMFGIHQLFMWLFICLILMFSLLLFSFLFKPRTGKGLLIKHQWQQFRGNFTGMKSNSWYTLPKADKERALIFSTGLKDQKLTEKSKTFAEMDAVASDDTSYNLLLLLSLFTIANTNFGSATEISAQSSNTTSYTGTGVGGGGGGSGAF
ncbi:hypothetical protein CWR48_19325 [Oceanobacillus arenosus]|uniref:DUF2207 domain-containing protein n=1 Tax=Oceanobacillus arenosus TaxID=1229153 RepID=A0A3D8PGH6_9BACI|nr:DUF2207 domain-containing protein [Oceanobacillus arenosus]RDW15184.1 hypothetical protein CWR48_19325 [Oceanobacillus arenosus]